MRNSTILYLVKIEYGPEINISSLKMIMKSGLEKNTLKFHDGLQSCCCPVQNNLPRKAELAWQVSLKGVVEFQNKKNLDHFSPSFLSQKCKFQDSRL